MRLVRGISFNAIGQLAPTFINIVMFPIYAAALGNEALGLIGIYAVFLAASALLDLGISASAIRTFSASQSNKEEADSNPTILRTYEYILFVVGGCAVALLLWIISTFMSDWISRQTIDPDDVRTSLNIMAVACGFRVLEGFHRSVLTALELHGQVASINVASSVLRATGAYIAILTLEVSIVGFFTWQLFAGIATSFACLLMARNAVAARSSIPARFALSSIHPSARYSLGILGIATLTLLAGQSDKIILASQVPLAVFGTYSISSLLAGAIYIATGPIGQTFYPAICTACKGQESHLLNRTFLTAASAMASVAVAIAAPLALNSHAVLLFWTRDEGISNEGTTILALLCLATLINIVVWAPHHLQLAMGKTREPIFANLAGLPILITSLVLLGNIWGPNGTAISLIILNTFYILFYANRIFKGALREIYFSWAVYSTAIPLTAGLATAIILSRVMGNPESLLAFAMKMFVLVLFTFAAAAASSAILRNALARGIREWRDAK